MPDQFYMAKKRAAEAAAARPELLEDRGDARARLLELLEQGRDLSEREFSQPTQLEEASRERKVWRDSTEEALREIFSDESVALEFGEATVPSLDRPSVVEEFAEFRDSVETYVGRLQSIIRRLDPTPAERPGGRARDGAPGRTAMAPGLNAPRHSPQPRQTEAPAPHGNGHRAPQTVKAPPVVAATDVFIVPAGDPDAAESVACLIEDLGLSPVMPGAGGTEEGQPGPDGWERAAGAGFAVVVATGQAGTGTAAGEEIAGRAFEIGCIVGRLGRGRVCVLRDARLPTPSDWEGVVFIEMDPFGAWRFRLAREMRAAGLPVDLNRL